MTTFLRCEDGTWRRGDEHLPAGLVTIIGHRSGYGVMGTNILTTPYV
jgi:hypothetical protein